MMPGIISLSWRDRTLWRLSRIVMHFTLTTRIHIFTIYEYMAKRDSLSNFELMVMLALIRLGEEAYGVPISREIEDRTGREVALGSVHAALERLETHGLIASRLGDPTAERGGRAKRYFRLTNKGLREAREAQQGLVRLWSGLPALKGGTI
jgi:PadR family transcriptional regulator PadR